MTAVSPRLKMRGIGSGSSRRRWAEKPCRSTPRFSKRRKRWKKQQQLDQTVNQARSAPSFRWHGGITIEVLCGQCFSVKPIEWGRPYPIVRLDFISVGVMAERAVGNSQEFSGTSSDSSCSSQSFHQVLFFDLSNACLEVNSFRRDDGRERRKDRALPGQLGKAPGAEQALVFSCEGHCTLDRIFEL